MSPSHPPASDELYLFAIFTLLMCCMSILKVHYGWLQAKANQLDGRMSATRTKSPAHLHPHSHPQTLHTGIFQNHDLMAPSFRGKRLVCFGCNKKSNIKYDGFMTQWECSSCDSMNFLDENGEITDPPVATDYAEPIQQTYTLHRPDSPPSQSHTIPFCTTCQKNQHLYTASLRQYYVETDPAHPEYKEMERKYYKYKADLEKRYPQVCIDCEPMVHERMQQASKTAKSDYLRRLLARTRARNLAGQVSTFTIWDLGKLLWYGGLFGQLLWNIASLLVVALHNSPLSPEEYLPPSLNYYISPTILAILDGLVHNATSTPWAWFSLVFSYFSVWWNPRLRESFRGYRSHIKGEFNWYKLQAIMLVTRSLTYYIMGTGILADPFGPATIGAHLISFGFNTFLAIMTHRSLKVDMTPLWAAPAKFIYVGPSSRSPSPNQGGSGMGAVLDEIAAGSTRGTRQPSPPSPSLSAWDHSPPLRIQSNRYTPLNSQKTRNPGLSSGTANTPLSRVIPSETTHYSATVDVLSNFEQTTIDDTEAMDWSPAPQILQTSFKPHIIQEPQLFGQTPITNNPFWYKVPPAPITPAHRIRNPPNQPRLQVASQEFKENFFNTTTKKVSGADDMLESMSINGDRKPRRDVEFAQQKFFPPVPQNPEQDALADTLKGFTLNSSEKESPQTLQRSFRTQHLFQFAALLLGFIYWTYSYKMPSEYFTTNSTLAVMTGCLLIGAHTIVDNTIFAAEEPQDHAIYHAIGTLIGGIELAAAAFIMAEIVGGRGQSMKCASFGNILISGMSIYELWRAFF